MTNLRTFSTRAKRSLTRWTSPAISSRTLLVLAPASGSRVGDASLLRPFAGRLEIDLDQRREEVTAFAEQDRLADDRASPSAHSRSATA